MMGRTHLGIGAGTWAAMSVAHAHALPVYAWPIGLAATLLGSLLPDIDHPKSMLGSKLWFISIPISDLFGHRGMTHSLIAATLAWIAISMTWWWATWTALVVSGLACGYLSHLLADYFTRPGIPLMWPDKKRYCAPKEWSFITGQSSVEVMLGVTGFTLMMADLLAVLKPLKHITGH